MYRVLVLTIDFFDHVCFLNLSLEKYIHNFANIYSLQLYIRDFGNSIEILLYFISNKILVSL